MMIFLIAIIIMSIIAIIISTINFIYSFYIHNGCFKNYMHDRLGLCRPRFTYQYTSDKCRYCDKDIYFNGFYWRRVEHKKR